tara:strand:+ start:838 stop:1257 length:420 start_codon:yes stop_codon:yes gene_type:complete
MPHRTEAKLFTWGKFISHAGNKLNFKIECDALSSDEWDCLASMIMEYQDTPFRSVEGIPRGGVPLAKALEKYATGKEEHQPMIVDDIYTTGKSFDDYMEEHYPGNLHAWGWKWVVFQRGPTKWSHVGNVKSLFKLYGVD